MPHTQDNWKTWWSATKLNIRADVLVSWRRDGRDIKLCLWQLTDMTVCFQSSCFCRFFLSLCYPSLPPGYISFLIFFWSDSVQVSFPLNPCWEASSCSGRLNEKFLEVSRSNYFSWNEESLHPKSIIYEFLWKRRLPANRKALKLAVRHVKVILVVVDAKQLEMKGECVSWGRFMTYQGHIMEKSKIARNDAKKDGWD